MGEVRSGGVSDPSKTGPEAGLTRRRFARRVMFSAPAVLTGALVADWATSPPADAATAANWSTTGNIGSAGAANFLGTRDAQPLVVRTANVERARFDIHGRVGFGTSTPTARVHVRATTGPAALIEHSATTGTAAALAVNTVSTDAAAVALSASATTALAILAQNSNGSGVKGKAIQALSAGGTNDRIHPSGTYYDAAGEFSGANGVIGAASAAQSSGYGVIGIANNTAGVGVYAAGSGGASAMLAVGNVDVFGTLTKSGGSFRIDHPLDPAGKYLSHSFVESPDMKNIYDGVVTADATGTAAVQMPAWFDALNADFRYQLTAIGRAAPDLHVAEELTDGHFAIAGAHAGQKVSWQVTGIRHDAWANAHRIPVEHAKSSREHNRFLHPELHGAPASARVAGQQVTH